ncbi:hypothetical protein ET33_02360 [Paenibacillus tyrfis]|uniref:YqbQ/XkdQ domain-containing protein n=1 Tax=Paenibacillus tyrfis TaxID=1501230 RepID=A0A081P4G0_9BACL|nr:hypothetical protein [Paenibacillus tyrfis]KEQ25583.1 hypothetical protein ET33_02360 [Paenibacillus tyrfis]
MKDARAEAEKLLKDVNRVADVEIAGNEEMYDLIAGNAVQQVESFTGLTGLFYIDSDAHTFENGQHTIRLSLNFKNIMDEHDGEEEKKDKSKDKSTSFSLQIGDY